jgi:hypothetical protein
MTTGQKIQTQLNMKHNNVSIRLFSQVKAKEKMKPGRPETPRESIVTTETALKE